MITRAELTNYLADYLSIDTIQDYAPNGLQVEGKESIRRICTAVTASEASISEAANIQADALLVHHGFFWRGEPPVITGMKKRRIHKLMQSDMSLFAYHLPLDCHLNLGNNACLAKLLDAKSIKTHTAGNVQNLLWSGQLAQSMTTRQFSALISDKLKRTPMALTCSDKKILNIAWCSGAAQDFIEEAYQLGADAYLSGEVSERTYYQAQELGIHYFSCGHHASERYGIQALGQHLSTTFGLRHDFIDAANPV